MKYFAAGIAAILSLLLAIAGSETPPKYGVVKPPSEGCIYMAFIPPNDDTRCQRSEGGRIKYIISPTGRVEEIHQHYSPDEFNSQVEKHSSNHEKRPIGMPGSAAYRYVKRYLVQSDEIWTYGFLDSGFVIIRNNKIFCLVVTDHML